MEVTKQIHEETESILAVKLAELTKEMNQFTYIVSHDLQAPLRMITGFLELLEKKHGSKLDDSAKEYIGFAVKGAAKMKNLVFDLLEYSRLSSVSKDPVETDLNMVLREVKEKLRLLISDTGAVINSDNLPVIKANKDQMVQLFGHLLTNSLKFRGNNLPEIDITLSRENNNWLIGVKDNGIGIDPSFSEKIFLVFRRLHADETKYSGTGIGLAVCKKIVELHGGVMSVDSAVNKGSTFYFTLPAAS